MYGVLGDKRGYNHQGKQRKRMVRRVRVRVEGVMGEKLVGRLGGEGALGLSSFSLLQPLSLYLQYLLPPN